MQRRDAIFSPHFTIKAKKERKKFTYRAIVERSAVDCVWIKIQWNSLKVREVTKQLISCHIRIGSPPIVKKKIVKFPWRKKKNNKKSNFFGLNFVLTTCEVRSGDWNEDFSSWNSARIVGSGTRYRQRGIGRSRWLLRFERWVRQLFLSIFTTFRLRPTEICIHRDEICELASWERSSNPHDNLLNLLLFFCGTFCWLQCPHMVDTLNGNKIEKK